MVEPDNGGWFDSEEKVGFCFQAWLVVGSSPRRMLVPSTVDGDGFVDTEDVGWKDFDLEVVVAWFQARWRWMGRKNCFFLFCFEEEENMIGFEDVELVVSREGGNKKFFANLF